jgi:5-methylcytosine-specific restriction endonuclease McrA
MNSAKKWLNIRLKLELSNEKTKIVNIRKHRMEFLGFELKLRKNPKSKKWTMESHISKKALKKIEAKLMNQLNKIANSKGKMNEINQLVIYNAMVIGIQNYYQIASRISTDLNPLQQKLYRNMYLRFKNKNSKGTRFVKKGRELTVAEKQRYGHYKSNRFIKGCGNDEPIYQVGCVKYRPPRSCKISQNENIYTPQGKTEVHNNLDGDIKLLVPLMRSRIYSHNENIEFYDNKISLYSAQGGKCAISGKVFQSVEEIHAHHKIPKSQGGKDNYQNLVLILDDYHRLIHASKQETIIKYIIKLQIDAKQLRIINNFRNKIGLQEICKTYSQLLKISKIDDVQILG